MPRIVSIPSRGVEVEFPDSLPDEEIDAYLQEKYPRSGEDVAFEVEQAGQQSQEGAVTVNLFEGENKMSRDDYLLLQEHKASKKSSLGDLLGIATDVAGQIFSDVGKGLTEAGAAAIVGEFSPAVQSAAEGMAAGGVGLYDIGIRILDPKKNIPTKEEFLKRRIPVQGTQTVRGDFGVEEVTVPTFRPATEQDYNDLIDSEMQKDADAVNRLYLMEDIIQGAPIEEIARLGQYGDPTMLAGGASTLIKAGAKTLFKKGAARTGAQTAAAVADAVTPPPAGAVQTIESGGTMFAAPTPGVSTAPGRLGQAALGAVETGAGAVQAVASAPGRLVDAVGNVVERVMPGTSAPLKAAAATTAMLGDAGLTAGTIAGLKTTEKAAEVAAAAARAARGEASRAGLLERVAQSPNVSTSARKLAEGLAQIQPALGVAKRVTAQALKEGAAGAAVGAGLGYLAERNLEGAAAGAGAGAAFGGLSGTLRGTFRAGREALGYSTERTARQATGDINSFIAERPEIEQGAWAATMSRLAEKIGPEKAAAQVDALRIAEANGGKVRVATPDEVKQWQNPGWMNVDGLEIVLNPQRILSDTAAHEATHVLFASTLNRAFKTDIENAIYGAVDPVSGEVVRPGLFTDPDLARIADQIADSYGNNTTVANEFRGYANRLRNTTDPTALSEARTRVADELTATYSGKLFGRLRAGRFNPDRLPLVYRRVLNIIEDGIVEKLRTTLFEQGMDLGFNAARGAFTDSKGRPVRIPELDAIIKKAMQPKRQSVPEAKAKPDLIPVNPADRAVWSRSYGGARGILNEDDTPKSLQQIDAEANARWQDMTSRLSALPENERIGLDFTRDDKGKTVMTAKGQLSDAAINAILSSDTLDQSAKATLREVLMSMKNFDKATFDTRYYGVYTRGRGTNKMVAGVKSASQNEILPYSVEMNSKDGVIIRAVDMTKVRDRLMVALKKPQFKDLYGNAGDALKDFRAYLTNLTNINAMPSETVLGGGVRGAQKRNLFYDALGFRLRNNETLLNVPAEVISKSKNTLKSYRAERFAKLVDSGERFAFEEGTTYERAMKNFQPDAFTKETLPNGEAMTNPDGYRILKQTGGKLFRVYDDKGELIGTASTETAAMKKAQSDAAKKVNQQAKKPSIIEAPPVMREFPDGYKLTQPGLIRFQPVRAYHGTPHKFDKFSTKKINTGEGAQAYGWGLYFAENWNIADEYRGKLQKEFRIGFNGKTIAELYPNNEEAVKLQRRLESVAGNTQYGSQGDSVRKAFLGATYGDLLSKEPPTPSVLFARQVEKDYGNRISTEIGGNLYTVDLLPDEADFLDWDKPLSEQSPAIQERLANFNRTATRDPEFTEFILSKPQGVGGYIYKALVSQYGDQYAGMKAVSAMLAEAGIPGIKYLDAGSRSAGEGSRNYVIFDDKLVKIIEENGKPVGEPTSTKRFQPVSPEQDASYLRAAQAGDTAAAQKMVDQAAKAAGFILEKVFHGGESPLTDLSRGSSRGQAVAFFTRSKQDAWYYAFLGTPRKLAGTNLSGARRRQLSEKPQRNPSVTSVYIKGPIFDFSEGTSIKELQTWREILKIFGDDRIASEIREWSPSIYEKFNDERSFGETSAETFKEWINEKWDDVLEEVKDAGATEETLALSNTPVLLFLKSTQLLDEWAAAKKIEAVEYDDAETGAKTVTINNPNNAKSSDPITLDDAGNIIPLSQRFNVESPDIRFQPDAASPSILNGSNGTRIIKSPSGKFRVYSVTGTLLGIRDTEQAAQKLATK